MLLNPAKCTEVIVNLDKGGRKLKHYMKVECPICGKITYGREHGQFHQGCDHFERVDEKDSVVFFVNDFGEELPVDLSAVGDRCLSFNCPICNEQLDACVREAAKEYKIEGKCPHFEELKADDHGVMLAYFIDDEQKQRTLKLV